MTGWKKRIFRERVEMLKKKRLELKAAKSAKRGKPSEAVTKESRHEESSSDNESDENFAMDWRAQRLWMLAKICYFFECQTWNILCRFIFHATFCMSNNLLRINSNYTP